eukprot:jgi/Bigna1/72743/fgenesh1_pg.21_\
MAARCPPRSPLIAALAIAFTLSLFQRDRQAPLKSRGTSIRAAAQCRRPGRNGDFTPRVSKYGCFGNVRPAKRTAVLNGLKGSINSLRGMMYMSQIPMRKEGQSTHSNRRTQRNRRMRRLGPPRMGLFDDDDEEEEDSDEEEDDDLVLSALKSKREGAFMPCGITFHTEKPIRITALRVPFECLSPEFWDGFRYESPLHIQKYCWNFPDDPGGFENELKVLSLCFPISVSYRKIAAARRGVNGTSKSSAAPCPSRILSSKEKPVLHQT